uniref:Uncharacterized protein n=1 Tax=Tanacetum cinerariifolium TaxID=118510 RepID=A0A6L2NGW5_TANCI|nr:hypothetical protein [Tanacetum cinerariifolium]
MGIVPTEMELILEQTQQGISHEVSRQSVKVKELQEILQVLKVTSAQGGKDYKMAERDYDWLKISSFFIIAVQTSGSGNTLHWQWELILPVGMPCAFYSQQSSPKLDAPSSLIANSWQWDLHSSGSGNTLHWQWELILPVGTLSWQVSRDMLCIPSFLMRNSSRARAKGLAMYSASVLDMVVLFYFFDDQLTNLSPNNYILPGVLFCYLAKVDAVQRLKENALRDYRCWFDVTVVGSRLMLLGKVDTTAEVT